MKQCPACRSQYTDDTLQYCLQDGTPLETYTPDPNEGTWRSVEPEEETVVSERRRAETPVAYPVDRNEIRRPASSPERKSRTGLLVFATAAATLLVLALAGAGYLIFSRGGRQDTARTNANVNVTVVRTPESTPTPSPTASPSPASNSVNSNAAATPNPTEVGREVTKAVAEWQEDTESLDTDRLMDRYADNVDYYRTSGASRDFVRRDKERAFSMYDSVRFEISNMKITPGSSPDTAVAEFDKAWTFDGENHSEGKVRSRLALKKIDGQWLINGERDLKVY
jgi:hypothetical protein